MFIIYGTVVTILQPEVVRLREVEKDKTEIFFSHDDKCLGVVMLPINVIVDMMKNNANIALQEVAPNLYAMAATDSAGLTPTAEEIDADDLLRKIKNMSDAQVSYLSTACPALSAALDACRKGSRSFFSLMDDFSIPVISRAVYDVYTQIPNLGQ